jgi:hypothetical protein
VSNRVYIVHDQMLDAEALDYLNISLQHLKTHDQDLPRLRIDVRTGNHVTIRDLSGETGEGAAQLPTPLVQCRRTTHHHRPATTTSRIELPCLSS